MKLSVIISCYNQANYLSQCVDSVIKQGLNDLEVIIVDDGSTDNSEMLGRKYAEKHPHIHYIKQDNKGVSAARNTGLTMARGEYITFLDGDDYVQEDYYLKLYDAAKKVNADTVIGNIRCFNELRTWNISYMKKVFNKSLPNVRHIKNNPELHFTPSVCNKLFRRTLLKQNRILFNEEICVGEDLLFTQQSLSLSNKTAMVNVDGLNYRFSDNEASLTKNNDVSYFNQLVLLQKEIIDLYKKLNNMEAFQIIEERQFKFFLDSFFNKARYFSEIQLQTFLQIGSSFLKVIQNKILYKKLEARERLLIEIILNEDEAALFKLVELIHDGNEYEHIYLDGKYYSYLINHFKDYRSFLTITQLTIEHKIEVINLEESVFTLGGYAFIKGISTVDNVKFLSFENGQRKLTVSLKNSLRTDVSYLFSQNQVNYHMSGFETVQVDLLTLLTEGDWTVFLNITVNDKTYKVPVKVHLAQLRNKVKMIYLKDKELMPVFINGTDLSFRLSKVSIIEKVKGRFRQLKKNLRYDTSFLKAKDYQTFTAIVLYKVFGRFLRQKDIWLIGERKDTAQDNSYHLYKYIRTHEPKVNIHYVIDKKSDDYEQVKPYGNIIPYGSLKHTLYLLVCSKSLNSYVETANMYTDSYKKIIKFYPEWQQNKKIFLQHGVIGVSRVNHVLHKNRMDYSMFVVSSPFEKEHIVKEFGYKEEEVVITGLARWDALEDTSKGNEILLMPTWRSWIKSKEQLSQSEYFKTYLELLKDERLHRLLVAKDLTLTFFPHYQTQKYLQEELPFFHERIRTVRQGEESVQQLLKRHQLLITDYSTVSFDFAYMNKPVIFFQFDYDDFYSKHYNEGPINHKEDLFGIRIENVDALIRHLASEGIQGNYSEKDKINKYIDQSSRANHSKEIVELIKRGREK